MAKLYFRVGADFDKVIKLREEIEKLKNELKNMDSTQSPETFKKLNVQLGESTKKMNILISEVAQAGAIMENDFKKGIYDGEKAVNSLSEEIIKQKNIIRETQNDVSMLTEQYKKLGKYDPKRQSLSDELNRAKAALGEQKYALGELQSQQALARLSTKALKDEYALFKDESKAVINVNEGVGVSFKKTLAAIGGIAMLKQVASNVVSTAGMFQKYESVLTNALNGSSDKAKAYLSDINSFAAKTNFQLNELTDDFIKFVNRGVTPSMDAMKKMGDFTNTVAKPFDQLTEAILDINNPERWKEFGVRVQTEGNKVKLSFRDMTVECDRTVESVMKAVEQFGSMKGVEGSTEAISKTIEGQMSNLEDTITTALAEIGLANQDLISGSISAVDTIVKNYGIIGKSVLALVEIYGVYRAGLLINTIVEQGSAKSIWAKITATKAATLAQATYNKVLMMNPYVLAGAAVVSLGIAMWTLADNTSIAEKAQERFNKKQEEAKKLEQERRQKIENLIQSSRDIALADLQRGQSLAELRKEYPKIFEKYDIETIKLADILKLKREIAEEDAKRAGEKKEKEFSDIEKDIKYYENLLKSLSGQQGVDGYVKKLKELRATRDVMLQDKGKGISEQFISSLKDVDISEFDRYISELEKRIKGQGEYGKIKLRLPIDVKGSLSDEAIYDVKDIKTLIDTAKSTKQTRIDAEKNKTTYQEDLATAKANWEKAKKGYEALLKDQKATSEQVKNARDDMRAKEKSYEDLGGVADSSKQENQAEKFRKEQENLRALQEKQSKDTIRQVKDLELEATQSKINAMDEGSEKTIAQMRLDHEKEIETLKRNREDYLQKKIDAERSLFESNPKNKGKSFDSSNVFLSKDEEGMFKNMLESTITKQGNDISSYYKELLSKYQGYAEKRLAIQNKFQQERDALVKAGASKEALAENDYQREETLQSIDNEFAMREDSFKAWADNIADLSLEKLRELLVQAEQELQRSEFLNPNDSQLAGQRAKVTSLKNTISEKAAKNNTSPDKRSKKEWQDLYNTLSKVEKEFDEIGRTVGGTVGEIISAAGTITTSTLQMIDGITTLANSSSDAMAGTAQAASKSIQAVEKASVILAIVGAALQITMKMFDLFGGDDTTEKYEKTKETYESYINILDKVIDKQLELAESLSGDNANAAYEKAIELVKTQSDAARVLGKQYLNSGSSWKSHSKGYSEVDDMSWEGWNDAAKALGMSVDQFKSKMGGRMEGLFDLTDEQLEKLQAEAHIFWAQLDSDTQNYANQIAEGVGKVAEVMEQRMTDTTLIDVDTLRSDFQDLLTDMDANSADFADNFEEYMRNAILNSMLKESYMGRLEEWRKKFYAAMDDGVTEQEYNDLKEEGQQIADDMKAEREAMADMFGWKSESSSQEATAKGFQAMSQDTGDELNGRFTALQISGEEIKNQNTIQSQSLNLLTAKADTILSINTETRNIADDTRDLIAQSYLELVQISENTGNSAKYLKDIKADMAEVKRNTSKL
ncbi:phage tail tape measure protein [Bacteroides nordii]|jgi:hypothetical protein|uniref:phage tail tape measure protein n=1 Tax=Bacteroides nordii TaxID=291645 RepID=UPI001EDDD9AE|nr:phage tail tape measure protein [Bacteroides nordii]MCG4768525.1 phage tail tape measure protein [Bacteroides nordii]